MNIETLPFTQEMIPAAGKLLAARHGRNQERLPLLPKRFLDPEIATGAVAALWGKKHCIGYATFRSGKMVAYLLGEHMTQPWARCGYVYLPGYALAADEPAQTLQDLYAWLGDEWVRNGVFSHGLYISAADEGVIAALFDLGFGKERIDALLDLRALEVPNIQDPEGITFRRAVSGDGAHLAGMAHLIFRELEKPPYWHPTPPEVWDDLRAGWAGLAGDPKVSAWLALDGEQVVGTIAGWREEPGPAHMLAGPGTFTFSVAATRPEYRGRGIASALTWTCLAHGREQGYEVCYTDWISANLAAARTWPRFGFGDAAYRLSKRIDPMIAWTRGENR